MGIFTMNKTGALDALTAELGTIRQAVGRETSKLTELRSNLVVAERDHASALGNEAVTGEVGGSQKAREHVARCRAEVEEQQKRVGATRAKLWEAGTTAAVAAAEPRAEALATEKARAVEAFGAEWRDGIAVFSALMARRRQIERLFFMPLALPDPVPSGEPAVDDALPLHSALAALLRGLCGAGQTDTSNMEADEAALRTAFLSALQGFEASERLRHAKARYDALQAEGR